MNEQAGDQSEHGAAACCGANLQSERCLLITQFCVTRNATDFSNDDLDDNDNDASSLSLSS